MAKVKDAVKVAERLQKSYQEEPPLPSPQDQENVPIVTVLAASAVEFSTLTE